MQYICPMRCEGEKSYPQAGNCPICGMHLTPIIDLSNKKKAENKEYKNMLKRLFWAKIFTLPTLILSLPHMLGLNIVLLPHKLSYIIQLIATIIVIIAGSFIYKLGVRSILTLKFNMWTLIAIGTLVAFIYSLFSSISYFETTAIIITLVILGQVLELKTYDQTKNSINSLVNLLPNGATVLGEDNRESFVEILEIQQNDILKVKAGESIPLDGIIIKGASSIDESHINGEAIPRDKIEGDNVFAGTINLSGVILVKVTQIAQNTMLAKIIKIVNDTSNSKPPIQYLVDKVSFYFVPAIIIISIISLLYWGLQGDWDIGFKSLISVLIIACPCALGLATPLSVSIGVGQAARVNILMKNATGIELMSKINTIATDKTGTLTTGKPTLHSIKNFGTMADTVILEIASTIAYSSNHPLSRMIYKKYHENNTKTLPVVEVTEIAGLGLKTTMSNQEIYLGNIKLLNNAGIVIPSALQEEITAISYGLSTVYLAINNKLEALFLFSDTIKEEVFEVVNDLKLNNLNICILSGDTKPAVDKLAKVLQVNYLAELSPQDKFNKIADMQSKGLKVAMLGDGINDTPALSKADIAIAMGGGTDIALDNADIVLLKGNLLGVLNSRILSSSIMRNIKQNLFFAFIYNGLGVALAFFNLLNPTIAGIAMALSSISVILNATRLNFIKLRKEETKTHDTCCATKST